MKTSNDKIYRNTYSLKPIHLQPQISDMRKSLNRREFFRRVRVYPHPYARVRGQVRASPRRRIPLSFSLPSPRFPSLAQDRERERGRTNPTVYTPRLCTRCTLCARYLSVLSGYLSISIRAPISRCTVSPPSLSLSLSPGLLLLPPLWKMKSVFIRGTTASLARLPRTSLWWWRFFSALRFLSGRCGKVGRTFRRWLDRCYVILSV